ncbi:extracellular solute-binding protein [Palleronia marisminoris]|uniref:Putative ABC transporter-binding protein n=1 Tax=Palleronia marisminoris TaxID=315423 RepID=A0A1Y5TU84_9RHOB|nr:extracellular solute-binding protein [Palleronia marisminoris]SFH46053.1 extracellular solute-binding protein [Palleronia marisminoris]SLN68211.1 putative ABC transporter-binding protein precursor [Palleronia marisminoris]
MITAMNRRMVLRGVAPALAFAATIAGTAAAQDAIRVISHRQPALEYYTQQMVEALPEGRVTTELMPIDKELELASITMSSESDAIDVLYLNDASFQRFAANGWLEPLDDLWEKYREEYDLDDFPQSVIDSVTYDGHIYSMPILTNTELFFYRKDLLEEAGIEPPETMEEYKAAAAELDSARTAGTIMSLKPVDAALNEAHWYMNSIGDGWFDEEWRPIFNNAAGVEAITKLKEMTEHAPRGFTSHANDESTINLQQGLAAMGLQWFTRAAAMDDPEQSRVVDQIDWVAPPGGGARIANDGFAISRFSSGDKEEMFRMMAEAASRESMREGAQYAMPPRLSILEDPALAEQYRWYPAARAALEGGKAFPAMPDFLDVGEIVTRHILRAVTGEAEVQAALDQAAAETEELLASRGYYDE